MFQLKSSFFNKTCYTKSFQISTSFLRFSNISFHARLSRKTNILSQQIPKDIAILTAIQLAFSCLMRISEFIDTESDHFLLSNDVFFLVIENNIDQHINCININAYHLDTISAVTITIRWSKNIPEGISNTLCFHKNVVHEGSFDSCTSIYN